MAATAAIIVLAGLATPLPIAHGAAAGRCQGERVTIRGTAGADVLVGTAGSDVIAGLGGADRIRGRGGSDHICGGTGDDTLRGGAGIDWLAPGAGRDLADGGRDTVNVVTYARAPGPVAIDLRARLATGWGRDRVSAIHQVVGSEHDDVLHGNSRGNALIGLGGSDRLYGRGGDDSLEGHSGNDRLNGGSGSDYVSFSVAPAPVNANLRRRTSSGEGEDVILRVESIFGSMHDDILVGDGRDNDFIGGINGNDRIRALGGDDVVYRYYGDAAVDGGHGNDTVYYEFQGTVDLKSGTAAGTDFSDTIARVENIAGGSESQIIAGDAASNVLAGGGGADAIEAGDGNDSVDGGGGDDSLAGGAGADDIDGGRGNDTCVEGERVTRCELPSAAIGRGREPAPSGDRVDAWPRAHVHSACHIIVRHTFRWFLSGSAHGEDARWICRSPTSPPRGA